MWIMEINTNHLMFVYNDPSNKTPLFSSIEFVVHRIVKTKILNINKTNHINMTKFPKIYNFK